VERSTFPHVVGWLGVELICITPWRRSSCSSPLRPPLPQDKRVVKTMPLSVNFYAEMPCVSTALRNNARRIGPVKRRCASIQATTRDWSSTSQDLYM